MTLPRYVFSFSISVANLLMMYDLIHSITVMIGLSQASKIELLDYYHTSYSSTHHT